MKFPISLLNLLKQLPILGKCTSMFLKALRSLLRCSSIYLNPGQSPLLNPLSKPKSSPYRCNSSLSRNRPSTRNSKPTPVKDHPTNPNKKLTNPFTNQSPDSSQKALHQSDHSNTVISHHVVRHPPNSAHNILTRPHPVKE